jgi:hypothetical protein
MDAPVVWCVGRSSKALMVFCKFTNCDGVRSLWGSDGAFKLVFAQGGDTKAQTIRSHTYASRAMSLLPGMLSIPVPAPLDTPTSLTVEVLLELRGASSTPLPTRAKPAVSLHETANSAGGIFSHVHLRA